MVTPPKKVFLEITKKGKIPPVYLEVPFISPHVVYQSLLSPRSFLLESIKGPEKIARYSFIGFDPCLVFRAKDSLIEIESASNRTIHSKKPFSALKDILLRYRQDPHKFLPPFQGGIVGMLSYDFVRYFERLSVSTIDDLLLPDAHFFMIDKLIAFDHAEKRSWIIVCPGVRLSGIHDAMVADPDWSSLYDEAEYLVSTLSQTLASAVMHPYAGSRLSSQHNIHSLRPLELCHDITKEYYMDMVIRAKEYIGAGDIFQANLSQRVSAEIRDRSAWDLYRSLRSINPSPFAAYADFGDYQIVCSSPERLLRVNQGTVETRPIAGTRPRGKNMMEDAALRRELLLNEKERAEHLMLIDLERNDLGRVSSYGTVSVDEHMITEDYSHVIHIVSNISGNLAHDKDCFDALRAVFPGGTITGVPKVRCMEIIDELELLRRGPYTGSIGYIGFSGNMDFNIIIRTFVIKDGIAYVQAGAGIVADSDPEKEYLETLKKAEALLMALTMI